LTHMINCLHDARTSTHHRVECIDVIFIFILPGAGRVSLC